MDFAHYAPATKAEAARAAAQAAETPAQAAPPVTPPPVAPAAAAAALAPSEPVPEPIPGVTVPRFVGGKIRSLTIPLVYPIEFNGRVYEAITLRRPSSAEVGQFFEALIALRAVDENATLQFPIFVDESGAPIPREVIEYLDGEDDEAVLKAAADFLPPRLRRLRDAQ